MVCGQTKPVIPLPDSLHCLLIAPANFKSLKCSDRSDSIGVVATAIAIVFAVLQKKTIVVEMRHF